jgi:ribonuclease III
MLRSVRSWLVKRSLDPASRLKIDFIEELTGFPVIEPGLYLRALRHRSRIVETNLRSNESYEQLEFLGDAVLDLIVTEIIYDRYPSQNEGFMTQMRSRIVKGETLAMISSSMKISSIIEVGDRVRDQGIESSSSVLADIFEALLGALYRDHGYVAARNFVAAQIEQYIDFDQLETEKDNFKSILLELAQSRKLPPPIYQVVNLSGPDHDRTFEIQVMLNNTPLGKGIGKNKKKAEQIAARESLFIISKEGQSA